MVIKGKQQLSVSGEEGGSGRTAQVEEDGGTLYHVPFLSSVRRNIPDKNFHG